MKLTIGIPVYNGGHYILEAVQSVLNQSYLDFELIVTDDGSLDETMKVLRSLHDPRLIIVCDGMHKGLATRLNEQIAMARGEYFARMDADDVMLPQRIERQMAFVHQHPEADVVGSSAIIIDEDSKKIGYRNCCRWERGKHRNAEDLSYTEVTNFMHPTVLGKTAWFRKYYYNPACEGCEDLDLWARSKAESIFYSLSEPLLLYRDPQHLNLSTYLYRRRQERYVLRLNKDKQSLFGFYRCLAYSNFKSVVAWLLSKVKLDHWQLRYRNTTQSCLNNHVLHVITSLRTGGAEKLMVDLLPRLRAQGKDVELVVFDGIRTPFYEALEKTGIQIHSFRIGGSVYDLRNIFSLIPLMRKADIVHTHNTAPQLFAAISNLFVNTTLFTTEHNTSNRRRNHPVLKPFDKWMYRQYQRVICISDKAEINLRDYLGLATDPKIETIYNGIDVVRFESSDKVSINEYEEKRVTMVAAFREQKDQPTLIRTLALLPEDYCLRLVGTGDPNLISYCKQLAKDLSLEQRVHFLGMRTDVPEILRESDVVVLSSHYEGLSLSSIEGMASGRPFIASDVDGLHEIVDGYGILVPHEDDKSLAIAIRKCCEDAEYAKMIGVRCQMRAKQFDISVMAEKYNNLYYCKE